MVTMNKSKKMVLIIILCIGIVLGIFGLIYIINNPKKSTEAVVLYNYSFEPNLSYQVHLVENELYEHTVQEEGAIYIKNILDHIKVDFSTIYKASDVVPLDMEYTVKASVIGFSSNNNVRTDYWKKDYLLSDKQVIHRESDHLQIEESLKIYLDTYEEFAKEANKITGVSLSTELVISMIGNIHATTPYGNMITPFDIIMRIPLQENLIEIIKGNITASTDQITESTVHTMPLNVKLIAFICIIIVLLIMGLLFTIFKIYEPLQQDIIRSEMKKLLKSYGSRMVALQSTPNKTFNHIYKVNGIKDLLVLSDEIQKPIYYVVDMFQVVKDYAFHVEDN